MFIVSYMHFGALVEGTEFVAIALEKLGNLAEITRRGVFPNFWHLYLPLRFLIWSTAPIL